MLAGIGLVGLVAAALAGAWLLSRGDEAQPAGASSTPAPAPTAPSTAPRATVPRVVGYSETRALVVLGEAHLTPRIVRRETRQATGTVVSQRPREGTEVDRKTRVTLVVDTDALPRALPDLIGRPYAEAAKLVERRGLQPKRTEVTSSEKPGTVVAQVPRPGTKLAKGATVLFSVAAAEPLAVPDLVGRTADEAGRALRAAGFAAREYRVPSKEPAGTVVAQSPAAGTEVEPGTSVRLNVAASPSTGTAPPSAPSGGSAALPDVVGMRQTEAALALWQFGVYGSVVYVPSQEPAGAVVAQARPAGTQLARGAHVQVNVSRGPDSQDDAALPGVTGEREEAARSALVAAGFTVQVLRLATANPAQVGIVVEQQPAGGRSVPAGSPVTLYVGRAR
jgi:serine/threonine-protein kinase